MLQNVDDFVRSLMFIAFSTARQELTESRLNYTNSTILHSFKHCIKFGRTHENYFYNDFKVDISRI